MINFGFAIRDGKLAIGGSVWKVMRSISGVPIDVKEWSLLRINGAQNEALTFNNAGDREFAYTTHYNEDWYWTEEEAGVAAKNSLFTYQDHNRREAEALAGIEHRLFERFP